MSQSVSDGSRRTPKAFCLVLNVLCFLAREALGVRGEQRPGQVGVGGTESRPRTLANLGIHSVLRYNEVTNRRQTSCLSCLFFERLLRHGMQTAKLKGVKGGLRPRVEIFSQKKYYPVLDPADRRNLYTPTSTPPIGSIGSMAFLKTQAEDETVHKV